MPMLRHGWMPVTGLVFVMALAGSAARGAVPVVVSPQSSSVEQLAAEDLARCLGTIYPREQFPLVGTLPESGPAILVGSRTDVQVRSHLGDAPPANPESYVVRVAQEGGRTLGVIAGADARGAAYGVYALLEKLGCGFFLSGDALPPARAEPFTFDGWALADQPLVADAPRVQLAQFPQRLLDVESGRLAALDRPVAEDGLQRDHGSRLRQQPDGELHVSTDKTKPVGYLSTTVKGRDWSTMHVNDVRRLFGGEVFDAPVFGADAALVPDDQRVAAAQALMQEVFADAAQRGDGRLFRRGRGHAERESAGVGAAAAGVRALRDAEREVRRPPASRPATLWLPNPDTPEGYALLPGAGRGPAEGLSADHDAGRLVPPGRHAVDGSEGRRFPAAWQQEFAAEIARTPEAEPSSGTRPGCSPSARSSAPSTAR